MAKFQSMFFTSALTKELKRSESVYVSLDAGKKRVTVSNGFFLAVLSVPEYDALIRPVTGRDPGSFTIDKSGFKEGAPDFSKAMKRTGQEAAAQLAPIAIPNGKKGTQNVYYSTERGASIVNAAFVECLAQPDIAYTQGRNYPLYFLTADGDLYALLLPIRAQYFEKYERMARAYFESAPADVEKLQREKAALIADRTRVEDQLVTAENIAAQTGRELNETRDQLEKALTRIEELETAAAGYAADLKEAEERAKEAEERADEKPADEKPALNTAGLEKLDGVTVVIKGAATNKPVAWITGETKKHAETLKKAGCKWSAKRSAWYLTA